MINFVLLGQVDNGKSTCTGRILIDTNTVNEREIEKAITDANNNGMKSQWLAYLVDSGTERLTGKTYEHTIVPLSYKNTQLNIIDVPGHKKYIKEMIAGASQANLAILICSAKKGELESGLKGQTYEHLLLSRSVGIEKLIVAINKMDHETVKWDEEIYNQTKTKIHTLINNLQFKNVRYIPISALTGVNILTPEKLCESSLLDLIINTKINTEVKPIYKNQNIIKAKCQFMNLENILTIGYYCTLHSGDQTTMCTLNKINKKPFISKSDKGFVIIELSLTPEIDITQYIILRDNDHTIGVGRVIIKSQ